ncbi:putative carboxylesterase 2 [Apostasia shenzhenica]|uniref:Putative carboxylesterase 2 n=1 Tax=Apostasia shenzhenica TaxID=1088818 RepID=A0A2I0A1R2_9ASPA|nr:putative carboxylesterase 2 [Apostasia shenzhenica]
MDSPTAAAAADSDNVEFEFPPFLRMYRSGRVERFGGTDKVPPSLDPATGVDSKDVTIDPSTGVFARLYLPPAAAGSDQKLPVLVYIHGGAFCIESAASPVYHRHLNSLSSLTPLLAVSVDYRLAPEHRLPAAYEDSWAALLWVFSRADPWLAQHGDFRRVFLSGDSAGANIAHQLALRAAAEGIAIKGLGLIHPFFWGSAPVGSEATDVGDKSWKFIFPETIGPDDPKRNPVADGAPSLASLSCERVLVTVAEKDFLKDRGILYYEKLKESGWPGEAELVVTPEANHVFHLLDADSEQGKTKIKLLAEFFKKP